MKEYVVPNMKPGEDNWAYCQRVADAIPPEAIVRALVARCKEKARRRKCEPWSYIGDLLGHGSGVSAAIVEKYS